jgi:hypothetical protein
LVAPAELILGTLAKVHRDFDLEESSRAPDFLEKGSLTLK